MVGNYNVITLCGSTKFKKEFLEVQKRLTLEGNIVLSVGLFGHSGDNEVWEDGKRKYFDGMTTKEMTVKEMLDDMHKKRIDMSDGIFVIDVGGYIGESTRGEIEYARENGKWIKYFSECGSGCDGAEEKYGIEEVGGFKFILNGEVVGESEEWKTCSIRCSSYERNGGDRD